MLARAAIEIGDKVKNKLWRPDVFQVVNKRYVRKEVKCVEGRK